MARESSRKCSPCGHNGHNSRTCKCNGKACIKLFGVKINAVEENNLYQTKNEDDEEALRKCKSMGNLQSSPSCNDDCSAGDAAAAGYLSDGLIHESSRAKAAQERRKGKSWSEDEHRSFLVGLEKHGKGDWKGISKNFVPSRTPTQVASHAQKYFLRIATTEKKRRRSSMFDKSFNELGSTSQVIPPPTCDGPSDAHRGNETLLLKTFEKPPLLLSVASSTHAVSVWRNMSYMVGLPNPGAAEMQNVSLVPVWSFQNQNQFGSAEVYCAPFMSGP